jgi:hypothetical protein
VPAVPAVPAISALQRTVGNTAVQRMLRRNNFRTATRKTMPVAPGQHRRHIVPHHAMKDALQRWWDVKGSQTADDNTRLNTHDDVQRLLDEMNNNTSNLWPGQGADNTAIGMLAHHMPPLIEEISRRRLAGQEAYDVIANYSGFQQGTQQQLADPVFEFVRNETNPREVVRFLKQVQLNAEIDIPAGNPEASVMAWQELRGRFERLRNDPVRHTEAHVLSFYQDFMNMPAPV